MSLLLKECHQNYLIISVDLMSRNFDEVQHYNSAMGFAIRNLRKKIPIE